jgi:hypothetical protein
VTSGGNVTNPGVTVRCLPVVVEGDQLFVDLG